MPWNSTLCGFVITSNKSMHVLFNGVKCRGLLAKISDIRLYEPQVNIKRLMISTNVFHEGKNRTPKGLEKIFLVEERVGFVRSRSRLFFFLFWAQTTFLSPRSRSIGQVQISFFESILENDHNIENPRIVAYLYVTVEKRTMRTRKLFLAMESLKNQIFFNNDAVVIDDNSGSFEVSRLRIIIWFFFIINDVVVAMSASVT